MSFERTTSQILFDNGTHKCISFTSLVKGEGIQANQFLIIDHERAAVLDPGGDLKFGLCDGITPRPRHYYLNATLVGVYRCQSGGF